MRALKLRRVDPGRHACTQAIERWRRAGQPAGWGRVPERVAAIQFRAHGVDGDWQGMILARDWLHQALPTLRSWLGRECALPSIVALFRAVPRPLPLAVNVLHYHRLSDVEAVDSALCPQHELPWLDTGRGRLWITRLPPTNATVEPQEPAAWLKALPLRLVLQLGVSELRAGGVRRLREGDVLRITERTQRVLLAHRSLGVFTMTEEGLHMQPSDTDADPGTPPPTARPVDLGAVAVRLEFVLATHDIDLGRLSQFIEGQLIPLAADAAQRIEIRANGLPVARGELVQLDRQLGVELLEVHRNASDE
ncbi:FliM/FliN family flagellar motor switch protein [Pseudomonas citrulli]|uniref:Surface presentation of antigens protein SpaO n=1 Tax=Pseudomonas citrulli TaxID=3064347 RepID=A0ABT9BXL5_9PSED|nr:FliM/FliN family flagellar motor switch protein [Pseudomonas sp. K18]MDO7896740.1 FliM/FliN family flagellar motor switch protein [Pseudomonas sp. K18]